MPKISELTAWATPIATDILPIVDVNAGSAGAKKITYANLLGKMPVGSVTAPTLAFTGDPNSGLYWVSADYLALAVGGAKTIEFTTSQVSILDGTVAGPGLSFIADPNCGLYRVGADDIAVAIGGAKALEFTTTQIAFRDGTIAAPAIAFLSDLNTGIYWPAADRMGFVVGGSQLIDLGVEGLKLGGTAARAGTAGTNAIHVFNGTAPTSTLANGCSIYSTTGELYTMDAAGNSTIQTPHTKDGKWKFDSKNTVTGRRLVVDMEQMMKFLNDHFGLDFFHEIKE